MFSAHLRLDMTMGSSASDTHIDFLNCVCPRCASFAHPSCHRNFRLGRGFSVSLCLLLEPRNNSPVKSSVSRLECVEPRAENVAERVHGGALITLCLESPKSMSGS